MSGKRGLKSGRFRDVIQGTTKVSSICSGLSLNPQIQPFAWEETHSSVQNSELNEMWGLTASVSMCACKPVRPGTAGWPWGGESGGLCQLHEGGRTSPLGCVSVAPQGASGLWSRKTQGVIIPGRLLPCPRSVSENSFSSGNCFAVQGRASPLWGGTLFTFEFCP